MGNKLERILSAIIVLIATAMILGWLFKPSILHYFNPNLILMSFNTASCFLLLGLVLFFNHSPNKLVRSLQIAAAIIVALWGLLVLLQYITQTSLGIDQLFVNAQFDKYTLYSGRMAPQTAICLILSSIVILILNAKRIRWLDTIAQVFIVIVLLFGIVGFAGGWIRMELLYTNYKYARMAIPTSFSCILLAANLWLLWYKKTELSQNPLSYRQRISTTAIVILTLSVITAGVLGFGILAKQMERALQNSLQETFNNHVRMTQNEINSVLTTTSLLSSRLLLQRNLYLYTNNQETQQSQGIIRQDTSTYLDNGFNGVAVYTADNQQVIKLGDFIQQPAISVPLYIKNPNLSAVIEWKEGVYLKTAVYVFYQNKIVGRVILEKRLPEVSALLAQDFLGMTSETRICAEVSKKYMSCFPSRNVKEFLKDYPRMGKEIIHMHYALSGKQGINVANDLRGRTVIAYYGPIGQTGLGMVYKIDTDELYAPVRQRLHYAIALSLLLVLIGLIVQRLQLMPLVNKLIESETEAKTAHRFNKTLLNTANVSIISSDVNGIIRSFNKTAEKMLGYSAEEVIGKESTLLFHDQELINKRANDLSEQLEKKITPDVETLIAKAKLKGLDQYEWTYIRKDGSRFPVLLSVTMLKNEAGEAIGSLEIGMDISEQKRLEKMKNEFISVVSHELRTPLTSIHGSISLLSSGVLGELPKKAMALLEIAKNNNERLIRLINDILDVEKIEAGKIEFQLKAIYVKDIIQEAITINQPYADKYSVQLTFCDHSHDSQVYADHDRLLQVLTNLLSNAIKFSPKNEQVITTTELIADQVKVSVSDKGKGIPKEFEAHIFQKFAQADASATRSHEGTGLGLSISKSIIERLGGTIGFHSTKNKGTTFYFELPVIKKDVHVEEESKLPPLVLIYEPDAEIAAAIAETFQKNNFKVIRVESAAEAKKSLLQNNVQALILDILLPNENALALISDIRSELKIYDLPIVIISIKDNYGKLKEMTGGFINLVDWVEKPVDRDRLLLTVQALKKNIETHSLKILHIEDNSDLFKIVSSILQKEGRITNARTVAEAKKLLAQEPFDVAILDLHLPDGSGLDLLPILCAKNIPVVVFSAYEFPKEQLGQVSSIIVKSKASNEELLRAIKEAIRRK